MAVTVLAQVGKLLFSAAFVIIYVLTAELFPSTVRNSGLSMCATFGKTASLISPYIVHLVCVVNFYIIIQLIKAFKQ